MTSAIKIQPAYEIICSTADEKAWLAARRTGIGASEAATLFSESPWDSPYALWARKSGLVGDKDETEPMRWGKLLEPVILAEYARRANRGAKPHGFLIRSTEYPWALATLDGTTWPLPANENEWPLEIKNSSAFTADEWAEGPPRPYYLQTQQQMLVTGQSKATISCLLGGNRLAWCDVARDPMVINKLIVRGEAMWRRVQEQDAPPVDGHEATTMALRQMYPKHEVATVMLPADLMAVADELESEKARVKGSTERVEELKNTLIAAIGSAEFAILPDGRSFTYRTQQRKSYTVAATSYRVLLAKKAKQ